MEKIEYNFGNNTIEFSFNDDLMVNATEMAAAYGKKPIGYLRTESAKTFINHLEKTQIRANRGADSAPRYSGNADFDGEFKHRSADLVPLVVVQKGGEDGGSTWVHRYIAIDLAMWLDVEFKIWILRKIDELLIDYSSEKRILAIRKRRVNEKLNTIISNSKSDEVKEIEKLLKEKNQIKGEEFNLNKNFNRNLFNQ